MSYSRAFYLGLGKPPILRQTIEKSNEYNWPLCIGFIDCGKDFDTVEHVAIFESLREIRINETYVRMLPKNYNQATARIRLDSLVSDKFPVNRKFKERDQVSPKLYLVLLWK